MLKIPQVENRDGSRQKNDRIARRLRLSDTFKKDTHERTDKKNRLN